jgi:hypothetical protein
LLKILAPVNCPSVWSTHGNGWFSRRTDSFSLVRSTHICTLPSLYYSVWTIPVRASAVRDFLRSRVLSETYFWDPWRNRRSRMSHGWCSCSRYESKSTLYTFRSRSSETDITLNAEKCEFSRNKVKFAGHIIDADGIRAYAIGIHFPSDIFCV